MHGCGPSPGQDDPELAYTRGTSVTWSTTHLRRTSKLSCGHLIHTKAFFPAPILIIASFDATPPQGAGPLLYHRSIC
eukprot:4706-Eustigmatos_ZCMA.PRE.1